MRVRFEMLPVRGALAPLVALLVSAGCESDDLLDVETPDIVTLDAAENAAGAEALRAQAIGDFARLINGNLGLATTGALMADELASGRPQLDWLDNRNYDATSDLNFRDWAASYNNAIRAIDLMSEYLPEGDDRDTKIGHMHALLGMGMVLVAEHYCNGVPFGGVVDGEMVFEETPLSYNEIFERAVAGFDVAFATLPAEATDLIDFARVGKGRALLNLDRPDEAAAAVTDVPSTFAFDAHFSATALGNGLYDWIQASGNFTPTHREGDGNYDDESGTGQGLDYIWSLDPRLAIGRPHFRLAQDGATRVYGVLSHLTRDAPIRVASGIEARLIEAEAALRAGGNWLGILNELRLTATTPALEPLTDPGNDAARVDMLFRERAFWMWLTAHRMGDLRRLIRQYGRPADAVFPSGAYFKGGQYGTSVVMEVHTSERNRPAGAPAYTGCANLDP